MMCLREANFLCTFLLVLLCYVSGQVDTQEADAEEDKHRVIGGREAHPGELPYQITLQTKFYYGNGSSHRCGGSIIDSEHVLTAGHCVYGYKASQFVVVAGVLNNTWQTPESTKVKRDVTALYLHEEFDYDYLFNDIAIVKVSPGFPTDNAAVSTIPLREDIAPAGLNCTVSGWGYQDHQGGFLPDVLQVVTVPFVPYETCRHINYTDGIVEPGMNCAGYPEGSKDACNGDSGGPLQCGGLLTGIVSWGDECALPDFPGVYTDVAYYKDWIATQLGRNSGTNLKRKPLTIPLQQK